MKKTSLIYAITMGGCFAFAPVVCAQNNTPSDATQNSKSVDSMAGENSNASTDQSTTSDRANSKDTQDSLDKNPSTASTDSSDKSATKDPNSNPTDEQANAARENRSNEKFSEKTFLVKAAEGGMAEVELGKLAQQNASSPDVKQFGARMVDDHSKANADLKSLADKKGITVPTQLDARHQASVDHLRQLSGPAFDRAYVKAMVKDHEKDASEFRNASTEAQDPDVKAFAGNTLKVIESHLSDVKNLQNKVQ
ncbi:MAG: DUF4142 domain-containing protein [Methylacidiphilales bacterium]|nr:DUF4142 domain-containing protein [Candidatus Methylacidiphilales bacterium]